jgi:hypothetical protein
MKSTKLALLALLIPSAALPMERAKNALKKTAPAAAAAITIGFLGYKAAQAYGINPWQATKNWLHSDCQQQINNEQERQGKSLADLRAQHEAALKGKTDAITTLEQQLTGLRSQSAQQLEETRAELARQIAALREQNIQLQEQLRIKEVAQVQAKQAARTELPVTVDLLQSIPSASAAESVEEIEDINTLYRKALRADVVNMASIFDVAKRAFNDELTALMVHNSRYDRIKEMINHAQFATQAFLREFTQADVKFEKPETVQRACTILARHQFHIDEIANNLDELEIALMNNIRANKNIFVRHAEKGIQKIGYEDPIQKDQRYVEFRSFIQSFYSRQYQCRSHEAYRIK